jgi:hypothetical protein
MNGGTAKKKKDNKHNDETTQLRIMIALVSALAETPVGLVQSEPDSGSRRCLANVPGRRPD